ncbi:MAG: UDP-N-acetylglucosamine 1-carboxyvinyltransferase [Propionibacteriales bacterium]|nr:MAG: UDP-N-acetylglucosamine 1-carboxyvinyltransferase [Propionibacteriales bacterium]
MTSTQPADIGALIRNARKQQGLTQQDLADRLNTSQSAITRIESGKQNLSLDMINRIATALNSALITPANGQTMNYRIVGGRKLSGAIEVRASKNASVALLCASLLNAGTTVLQGIAQIEEVARICEVLTSIGVSVEWSDDHSELTLRRPQRLQLENLDREAAEKTRSIIMFLGPLMHLAEEFSIPYSGGCNLGQRTVRPHLHAVNTLGLDVVATEGEYQCRVTETDPHAELNLTLVERGDTVTENAIMGAALREGITVIRNASSNYMVQDLCAYLQLLGVEIEGIGSTILRIRGKSHIDQDVTYSPSEDPIEAMTLITAAVVTDSVLTIRRAPIEFLDVELVILKDMGLRYTLSPEYVSHNGLTRLVDITIHESRLEAYADTIHPMPFPGLNIDNLPFFAVIACHANGRTLINDWVYDNRAVHLLELAKLGAKIELLDVHRLVAEGPTRWRAKSTISPAALRPAVCFFLAALAAKGETILRDVYVIRRGYDDLPRRLNALGAEVSEFRD